MMRVFILFVCLLPVMTYAKRLNYEQVYQNNWCPDPVENTEFRLVDGSRVDCIYQGYAIEFDFADKWAEAIGQALYYAHMTDKKPGVVLIIENPAKELIYIQRFYKATHGVWVELWIMTPEDL